MYPFDVYAQYGTWSKWLEQARQILIDQWGLDNDFADRVAILLAYGTSEGLVPSISRGWSDPKHQAELRARWDRGDRQGLRVRPAANSKHTVTGFLGSKKAQAIDIPTRNDSRMAQIAKALGIGSGLDFHDSDPGHFFKV